MAQNSEDQKKMRSIKSKSSLLSPLREIPKKLQSKYLRKGDGILPGVGLKSHPEKEMKVQEQKTIHKKLMEEHEQFRGPQRVRIQKGAGKYEVVTLQHGMTISDLEKSSKKQQQKEDRDRCKQLEKLMKYREEKLKKDQELIKKEK